MASILNTKGTSESIFSLGKQGPKLKNNSGVIEFRNSTDTSYIGITSIGLDDNASSTALTLDSSNNTTLAGRLFVPVGSAANPSISFTDDPDTGFYRAGGNRINFVTGGITHLSIDSVGAVEIGNAGSTGISAKFDKNANNVNYFEFGGAITTAPVTVNARGTDDNVDITINSKGTGEIRLVTNSTNALVIDGNQQVGINKNPSARLDVLESSSSFSGNILSTETNTTAGSGFNHILSTSDVDGTPDPVFRVQGDGAVFADGSYTGTGADYADYFEWEDGNPNSEDRVGCSVVMSTGGKIRIAQENEIPFGVISGKPSVAGNAAADSWADKFLKDDFHRYILEDGKKTVNPNFNPDATYIPRPDRLEWDAVGLVGRLPVKKGQVLSPLWIKIRDISDKVEEWLITGGTMNVANVSITNPLNDDLSEEKATEMKLYELSQYFYLKLSAGFVWNGETFDIDERAQYNISAEFMYQSQSIDEFPKDFEWRGYENQSVNMTKDDFYDFVRASRNHVKLMRETKTNHEKGIRRKRLAKTVMAYDVTTDWPETAEDFLNHQES